MDLKCSKCKKLRQNKTNKQTNHSMPSPWVGELPIEMNQLPNRFRLKQNKITTIKKTRCKSNKNKVILYQLPYHSYSLKMILLSLHILMTLKFVFSRITFNKQTWVSYSTVRKIKVETN